MWKAITEFCKQSTDKILCILSGGFLLIAFCRLSYQNKNWSFSLQKIPNWLLVIVGIAFLVLFILRNRVARSAKIKSRKLSNGYEVNIDSRHQIKVVTGNIQDCKPGDHRAVVLPANTAFDDECITDKRSALGSFFLTNFPSGIADIHKKITKAAAEVCLSANQGDVDAPVGTSIFLRKPLGSNFNIIVTAVTTIDENFGIQADTLSVIASVKQVLRIASQNRISAIDMPVIGTGHGGLDFKVALSLLLAECLQSIMHGGAHHVTEVTIVVYDPDGSRTSSIRSIVGTLENMVS